MTGPSRTGWQEGRRSQRFAVLAAVFLLHVVLVMLWRPPQVLRWPTLSPAARPPSEPLVIRLLPLSADVLLRRREVASVPATRQATPATTTRTRGGSQGRQPMATIAPSTATPAPATAAVPTAVAPLPDTPNTPTATAATTAPPALDLSLPRAWQRPASAPDMTERARLDPRANTGRRPSLERSMAAALSNERSTETLADGTQRIREGARCTLVHPSRASGLDAFDHTHNQIGGSEPCP